MYEKTVLLVYLWVYLCSHQEGVAPALANENFHYFPPIE